MVLKKGGIIIERKLKNALLNKAIILVPIAIFIAVLGNSNTLYAQSAEATKDRIKEIKFVEEDFNVEKLTRNKSIILAARTSEFTRNSDVTSRSIEEDRNKIVDEDNIEESNNQDIENKEEIEDEKITVSISKSMDLTKRTGLSKSQFKKLIQHVSQDSSKFFLNNADTIYDLCEQYEINEIFFCGLISAESGWNIAGNHRKTHNYISLMSKGKLIQYSSTYQGLEVAAQKLHYNYLTPGGKFYGGKTLAGVQKKFCPSGSWIGLVYGRMSSIAAAAKKI